MNPTRILIGVASCRSYKERRDACRATWLAAHAEGVRHVFFVGGSTPLPDEPDTIVLDCPDTYETLPAKVRAFFTHALKHESFDWLFKCDDDTYVAQQRLLDLAIGDHELAGNADFLNTKGYASGGAGYLLSRRAVGLVAGDDRLPNTGCEDIIITKAALRHGATPLPTPRLVWTVAPAPQADNDIITCHWCNPRQMSVVHAGMTDEICGQYHVTHQCWQDRLHLYKRGIFRRASTGCAGNWSQDSEGRLHLQWFDWAEEIVQQDEDGYKSDAMRLVPLLGSGSSSNPQRTVVMRLMGGMGNQMFQYAFGLALAKQTGALLKLTHTGSGRSAYRLHHFGLELSSDVPNDIPTIVDESGYFPGMESRILRAAEIKMNPIIAVQGYFQHESFFSSVRDLIWQQFQLAHRILPECRDKTPVCVHVRRTDYVDHPIHDVCSQAYYETSRKIICSLVKNPCFVIFSDDLAWCKENMNSWPNVVFCDIKDELATLEVMYGCRAFIIPNSTFSWWAAWMSGSQMVIRPDRYLNKRHWEIGPDRWMRVPGEGVLGEELNQAVESSPTYQPASVNLPASSNAIKDERHKKQYRVFCYRHGGNLGDTIQTLALTRLLPEPIEGVYRDAADFLLPGATFVVNGYLCEDTPSSPDCFFAGIYIGSRKSEQLAWLRQSRYPIGARDPATLLELKKNGLESEMIGCATLTLPRYTGERNGCIRIDDLTAPSSVTQIHNDLLWHPQCSLAFERLELLKKSELVVTSRLHVALPCLAFGTPVMIPSRALHTIFQPDRLSLLDFLGFEYDKPNVIDVSKYAEHYISFLERNLEITIGDSLQPKVPNPTKWGIRSPL